MRKFLLAFALLFCFLMASAQNEFKTVYKETKTNGTWSGTLKTGLWAAVGDLDKGGPYEIRLWDKEVGEQHRAVLSYQTETSDGKAFHQVVEGVWGECKWVSHSGDIKVDWVYMNKDISLVLSDDPKPFDIEIQFSDGSAVKYYISP